MSFFDDNDTMGWPGLTGSTGGSVGAGLGGSVGTSGGSLGSSGTSGSGGATIGGGFGGSGLGGSYNGYDEYDPGSVASGGLTARVQVRETVLQLKGNFPAYSNYYTDEPAKIRSILNAAGWNVSRVVEISSGVAGLGTRTWNIYATTNGSFSDTQITNQARRDLESAMNVSSVSIVQLGAATYVTAPANGSTNISGGTNLLGIGGSDFLSNFAVGLGVSTTVVLAGAAVLLILIAKR